jgi:hypothetical protein
MILTPIRREDLADALDRFERGLGNGAARTAFRWIRATSPDRAAGAAALAHRRAASALARACGLRVHRRAARRRFNWDGRALSGASEAYVILHEIAHWALATPARRRRVEFGLGPGPDTIDRAAAARAAVLAVPAREADEAAASLLGILWEARLGQPALASFLDQNWLEGLDRSAAAHFERVIGGLRRRRLLSPPLPSARSFGAVPPLRRAGGGEPTLCQ